VSVSSSPAPGWYRNPAGPGERWWNGVAWSDSVRTDAAPPVLAPPQVPAPVPPYATPAYATPPVPQTQPYPGAQPVPLAPGYAGWNAAPPRRPVTGMGSAISAVMGQYATFTGRASRPEYWYWYLFSFIVTAGAYFLLLVPFLNVIVVFALFAWVLGVFLPTLAVTVRRLRDAGIHWGFLFLGLVPFGGIAILVMLCQPSKPALPVAPQSYANPYAPRY
jgi:uncharacterized membrane protein YhaH (DUF805 family)